jgi:ATP-dependent RNA helicase DeaD
LLLFRRYLQRFPKYTKRIVWEAFKTLGLDEKVLQAIQEKGFEEPTEIQKLCIPRLLEGKKHLIAQAQTGTGKTGAFGLVFIQNLEPQHSKNHSPQAIVLTPTRELAIQVAERDLLIFPL